MPERAARVGTCAEREGDGVESDGAMWRADGQRPTAANVTADPIAHPGPSSSGLPLIVVSADDAARLAEIVAAKRDEVERRLMQLREEIDAAKLEQARLGELLRRLTRAGAAGKASR